MTPQEKNVFGKLFTKTELASQKVDLAGVAELNKFVTSLSTALDKVNSNRQKLGANLRDIDKIKTDLKINYNTALENKKAIDLGIKNAEILLNEIVKQAKDLGIDPRQIDNVDKLVSLVREIEGSQETVDSFINTSKQYI
jgi:hypothetical protein